MDRTLSSLAPVAIDPRGLTHFGSEGASPQPGYCLIGAADVAGQENCRPISINKVEIDYPSSAYSRANLARAYALGITLQDRSRN